MIALTIIATIGAICLGIMTFLMSHYRFGLGYRMITLYTAAGTGGLSLLLAIQILVTALLKRQLIRKEAASNLIQE